MKVILFSSIHFLGKDHNYPLFCDVNDWQARAVTAFDEQPRIFIIERGSYTINPFPIECELIYARIPDSKPYHCKNWSYGVAAFHSGLHYVMQQEFDLCVFLFTDTVLGVPLQGIADEFMTRPEAICGPQWHDRLDTNCMLLKPEAINNILYSVPFMPLAKLGPNLLYYESALSLIFAGRWWNPWPEIRTIRQEYGTPEVFKGKESEMMDWPMLTKASPDVTRNYRAKHPLPLK